MPAPLVLDIEFLAKTALCFDRKAGNIRVAYWAGLVCGLEIAKAFAKARVTIVEREFEIVLSGTSRFRDETSIFVEQLCSTTVPKLELTKEMVPESGLRFGRPGEYYSQGIRDATKVGIEQVPMFFKYAEGDDWLPPTIRWISQKIAWAKQCLAIEKSKALDFIF